MKQWSSIIIRTIPAGLIVLRFLLGPVLLLSALGGNTLWFMIGFIVAFLSDIFDGIIARRLGVSTKKLREYDGWVDTWFYGWIVLSLWLVHRAVVIAFLVPLLIVVSTQLFAWMIDLVKFRRVTNYHAYSSKAWGVTLFVSIVALFGFGYAGITLWVMIIVGVISHLEEMAMTLTLPRWMHDVPSIVHAIRIRREMV